MIAMKPILPIILTALLGMPLAASAQQSPYPNTYPATQQGMPGNGMPKVYRKWSRLLGNLNLSSQQHQQIQGLLDQYASAHPAGSQRDPQAARQLREQIFAVLTPDQQNQLRQQMEAMKAQRLQRRLQHLQQQGAPGQPAAAYPTAQP
jgi:Spy/CpxP family protein refolding chaperone